MQLPNSDARRKLQIPDGKGLREFVTQNGIYIVLILLILGIAVQDANFLSVNNFRNIQWAPGVKYGDVNLMNEREQSTYYFEVADVERLRGLYDTYPAHLPLDVLEGRPLDRHLVCRTLSDCTTAPRNGLISGCFPLDEFYKQRPERAQLAIIKRELRAEGT